VKDEKECEEEWSGWEEEDGVHGMEPLLLLLPTGTATIHSPLTGA
jgi:hypothetical protein